MFKTLNALYSGLYRHHGDSSSAVAIPRDNQHLRFQSFDQFLPKGASFSYVDFGCGLAHQLQYLLRTGNSAVDYVGVDVNEDFLNACRQKYPRCTFYQREEFFELGGDYDYIGAIGVFNIVYMDATRQQKFVFEEITRLFELTSRAVLLNFMHTAVDFVQERAWHQEVGALFQYCSSNLSRKVALDATYLPYEYTFAIFR